MYVPYHIYHTLHALIHLLTWPNTRASLGKGHSSIYSADVMSSTIVFVSDAYPLTLSMTQIQRESLMHSFYSFILLQYS